MILPLHRGVFITFEGGEGAGKTTLIEEVARQLASDGYYVVKTREPGGLISASIFARCCWIIHRIIRFAPIRNYASFWPRAPSTLKRLFYPHCEARKIVFCDRFNDSTIAYQGDARGLGAEKVTRFCDFICHGVQPNLTLYLDIDPAIGLGARPPRSASHCRGSRI